MKFRASPYDTYYYSLHAEGYQTESVHGKIDPSEEDRKTIKVERSVHQLTVSVTGSILSGTPEVTIRRQADGAETTKRTGARGNVDFDVYEGKYVIIARDDNTRRTTMVTVTEDTSINITFEMSTDH